MKIGKRFIDGDNLLARAESVEGAKDDGPAWEIIELIRRLLTRTPKAPKLCARQRAADIIGVGSPYVTVLVEKGDLSPIPVDGGPDVYDERECKEFAKSYKKRQRKRSRAGEGASS